MKKLLIGLLTLVSIGSFAATEVRSVDDMDAEQFSLPNSLDLYKGHYYVRPGYCDSHVTVSGNQLIISPTGRANGGNDYDPSNCHQYDTAIYDCDVSNKSCTMYISPAGRCDSVELNLLDNGNIVLLNKCTGKNYLMNKFKTRI